MAAAKQYGVYQPGRQLIAGTVKSKRASAKNAFMRDCQCDDWNILKALGYRVVRLGLDLKGRVRAQPLSGPGLPLPWHEHEQQPKELVKLLVAHFKAYLQRNHRQ